VLLLIGKAHPTMQRLHAEHPNVGRLIQPKDMGRIEETDALMPWAADNAAFSDFDAGGYERMLRRLQELRPHHGLFITAPDVVGDAEATLGLFDQWVGDVALAGPVALVAQDGLTPEIVPWIEVDALFVGGTTEWKLSVEAYVLVQEAKRQGKWVHMGRVNTWRRAELAKAWGCDSIDGTKFSRWTDSFVPEFSRRMRDGAVHVNMWEDWQAPRREGP
jgi:hypothetical protein